MKIAHVPLSEIRKVVDYALSIDKELLPVRKMYVDGARQFVSNQIAERRTDEPIDPAAIDQLEAMLAELDE